jgi:hypothetical protein
MADFSGLDFDYDAKIKEIDDSSLAEADKAEYKKAWANKKYAPKEELFTDDQLNQYRKAVGAAYEVAKLKYEDTGAQQRKTLGKQAEEERAGALQKQEFSQADEARDYAQARGAYKY